MSTANKPQTFLDRDNWMRAVLASGEPYVAIAIAIALHLNVQNRTVQPQPSDLEQRHGRVDALGRAMGCSARTRWMARHQAWRARPATVMS
jgi:hypothetical protein